MLVSNIKLSEQKGKLRISAHCKTDGGNSKVVYFEYDSSYHDYLNLDYSSFAAALLLPSMKLGEDLVVEGSMSKKLYDGMQQIMNIVKGWDVGLNPIKVIPQSLETDSLKGGDILTTFSGGVDSFYSWLTHKNDSKPVRTMMFINGFDISLDNQDLYRKTIDNIKKIAEAENAKLIEAESNIRSFIDPILGWGLSHGGCLAATALCLRNGIDLMYIPSSYTVEQEHPWGSHRLLDGHWSTEVITFMHDGYDTSRVDKVVNAVGHSQTALNYLRVCWKEENGSYNCGRCNKCLRTMVNLYVANSLDKSKTFPRSIDISLLEKADLDEADVMFVRENISALKQNDGSLELIVAYEKSLSKYLHQNLIRRTKGYVLKLDRTYLNGSVRNLIMGIMRK